MSFFSKLSFGIKRYFISGVLVVVPVILTYIVLKFLFESLDGLLQPIIHSLLGYYIPGLGVFTTLLLIIFAGILTRNFIGAKLFQIGDKILDRVPIIRPIYSAAKQLLSAVAEPSMSSFKEVALVEYPRKGVYALGFISNKIKMNVNDKEEEFIALFMPSTPTPISGMVIVVPKADVIPLEMTVEAGFKFLVSGGVASPDILTKKKSLNNDNEHEVIGETS